MRTRSSRMQSAWCQSAFNSIIETECLLEKGTGLFDGREISVVHTMLRSPVPFRTGTEFIRKPSHPSLRSPVPELPEVETVVRELRPQLVGRRLRGLRVSRFPLRREWSKAWSKLLHGRKVSAVRRRGKWIILDLHEGAHLVLHLGMTGQLTVKRSGAPLDADTHLIVDLDRGQKQLRFRDIRRFGSATVFQDANQLEAFLTKTGLGPEPFDVPAAYWRARLAGTNRCLRAVLLAPCVLSG